jgi:hypothetical protein
MLRMSETLFLEIGREIMVKTEEFAARRRNIQNHIDLLKSRYTPEERAEAVVVLEERLSRLQDE